MICQKASRTEGNLCNLVARFPDESGESVKISTTSSNDPIGGDRHSRVTYIWCRKLEGEKRLDRTWLISNIRYSKFTLYGEQGLAAVRMASGPVSGGGPAKRGRFWC
jgi:hypothetical protein